MTTFQMLRKVDEWDDIATEQQWQPEWVENIGLALSSYLQERTERNKGASLVGFIDYLEKIAPTRRDLERRTNNVES